ncbi:hypothetical protein N9Y42_06685 [Mariniblastus sp.]|nr:hypothetical protein [Mariniblastus sp.]
MSEQRELGPAGLSRKQFSLLTEHADRASSLDEETLLKQVRTHQQDAVRAHERNRLVNLRLATALCESIERAFAEPASLDTGTRYWLKGGALYFADSNDDEPDFTSALGFEDDAELLNACLKHARLPELCITIEDYDEA